MTDATLLATIRYPHDERILSLFAPEDKEMGRARYTVELAPDCVLFIVHAHDATALRAALSTITKVLSAWEATRSYGSSK
jgi:tRNA threonylcarbamoyladenosine modification (KEOPS) complex  Pcc1 subunit